MLRLCSSVNLRPRSALDMAALAFSLASLVIMFAWRPSALAIAAILARVSGRLWGLSPLRFRQRRAQEHEQNFLPRLVYG